MQQEGFVGTPVLASQVEALKTPAVDTMRMAPGSIETETGLFVFICQSFMLFSNIPYYVAPVDIPLEFPRRRSRDNLAVNDASHNARSYASRSRYLFIRRRPCRPSSGVFSTQWCPFLRLLVLRHGMVQQLVTLIITFLLELALRVADERGHTGSADGLQLLHEVLEQEGLVE